MSTGYAGALATFTNPPAVVDAMGRHPLEPVLHSVRRQHRQPWTAERVLEDARAAVADPCAAGARREHLDALHRARPVPLQLGQFWEAEHLLAVLTTKGA